MSKPPNILLVDDEAQIRRLARSLLQQEFSDVQIREVDSLDGLQQALEIGGFDVVITDYRLVWTDGLTVLRSVKSRYPDCPVVMFTGTGSEEIAVEAMRAGLDDYVLKSSSEHVARLALSVRTVLARAEERRSAREADARYRSLINDVLDTSAVGLFILDASFTVVWVNQALERCFGLRRADVVGQDKRRLIQERVKYLFDRPDEFAEQILRSYEQNDYELRFECRMPAADGREECWLEHRSLPIRTGLYAGGRTEHYYDITERKRAEEQILFLSRFPDENPNPILRVKADGTLLYANKAGRPLEEQWGWAPGRMVAEPLRRHVVEALAAGKSREWEDIVGERTFAFLLVPFTDAGYTNLYGRDVTLRKRTEEVLRQSEERFKTIFDQAPMGIALINSLTGRICAVNAKFAHIAGRTVEEMTRIDWMSITHPDDMQKDLDHMARLNAGEITGFQMEKRYLLPAGGVVWINMTIAPVAVEDKTHPRHLCMIEDITERKQAERVLQENKELLQAMGEMAKIGGWEFDAATRKGTWTEEVAQIHEVDVGQQPDVEKGLSYFHGESRQKIEAAVKGAVESGRSYDLVLELVTAKGNRKWVRTIGQPIKEGTQVVKVRGAIQDVTELKQSEDHLRQTNETLSSLIQASPMGIAVLDAEEKVRVWNQAAERIFGWSEAEVLGGPLPTVPDERRDEHRRICERALLDEATTGLEVVRRRKDGSPVTISLSTAPLRNAKGRIVGIMGIMADITERKQMEQHAGRIERLAALGQLLGGVAHEIKNPIFVLTGRVQLCKEKLAAQDYDTLPSDLDKIEEAAKRIAHVSERFLALARPVRPQQTQCDIRAVLDETLTFLSNELMKNQIRLVTELPPDLPRIWSDPHQLQEVFLNLLLNAKQAMVAAHGRGTLTVSAAVVPGEEAWGKGDETKWIEVRIQDDGPGILPEHKPRLFEPFFSTKPAGEGTGLGLWTVRMIVMALGGAVACESEVGRGTTFILRLPTAEPGPAAQAES